MTNVQVTMKRSNGDHEKFQFLLPDAADEASIRIQKDTFYLGVNYMRHRAREDGTPEEREVLNYEAEEPDAAGGDRQTQETALNRISEISTESARRIERDRDLNQKMDEVLNKCKFTENDAQRIKNHLSAVYKLLEDNQDGRALSTVVKIVVFLEYGFQLVKKYVSKMHNEGKVGVFIASVVWGLVTFLRTSGILTSDNLRALLQGRPSHIRPGYLATAVGLVSEHRAIAAATAVAVVAFLGTLWYLRK